MPPTPWQTEILVPGFGQTLEGTLRVVWARRVSVEIDDVHTVLGLAVAVSGMPRSVAETNIADLGEPKAAPLTSWRQTLAALSGKLISQCFLLPIRVAKDYRAEFARVPVIRA